MRPPTTRGRAGRVLATATLALALVAPLVRGGAAGAHEQQHDTQPDRPQAAPAPLRLTSSGLRPLTPAEASRLSGATTQGGPQCDIDFDDDGAISLLFDYAVHTFALSPWWNQECGGNHARVYPTDSDHFHLGYVDSSIGPCVDSENPHGTPVGEFSRGDECEPIDPLTEPRSDLTVHLPSNHIRLDLIDSMGLPPHKAQPFTLDRVRIRHAAVRVCYRMPPEGPWIAAAPVGPFDLPGLVYCWPSLAPGLWDLSDWTVGTVDVSFTGAAGAVWGLDDLRLS